MRHLVSILIVLFLGSVNLYGWEIANSENGNAPARTAPKEILDKSSINIVYTHNVYDPLKDKSRLSHFILQIGKNYSKYDDYGFYRVDSAINTSKHKVVTNNHYDYLCNKYNITTNGFILKDLKHKTLKAHDHIFIDNYLYSEPIPNYHWELENDTKTICGHLCHKASCTFRGRTWTAWYCDIASNNGPWKFGGLPGLILEVVDSKKEHHFKAISIKKGNNENICYKQYDYLISTRLKVKKAQEDYVENYDKIAEGFLKNADGSSMKLRNKSRLFYNPIELE